MTPRKVWLWLKTPLTMLALLALVAWAGLWGFKAATTPIPKQPPPECVNVKVGPTLTPDRVYLRMYNGTATSGLAKNVAKLVFGSVGFHVFVVKNAEEPVAQTYIVGSDANSPEVKLVRSYFPPNTPFKADPVMNRNHMVDVYLGSDFDPKKVPTTHLASVPLANQTACVPSPKELGNSSES